MKKLIMALVTDSYGASDRSACCRANGDHCQADTVEHGRSSDTGLYPHSKSKRAFSVQNYRKTRTQKCTHARHYRPGHTRRQHLNRKLCH